MAFTIRDIARMAGVGTSTVSRVLNNTGYVGQETRARVLKAVEECQFVPNVNARGLKVSACNNIGLFVKGITNPFFSKMIRIIEEKCALRGYPLIIRNVDDHQDELELAIQEARCGNLCGVILMGGSFSHTSEQFSRLGVPCTLTTITAGDEASRALCASVRIDDEKEGRRVTEYLLELGHRRIGFIYEPPTDQLTTNQLRYLGYRKALADHAIPFDSSLVANITETSLYNGYATGFSAARALYTRNHDLTAIVAFSDVMAIGAMKGLFSLGLKVPEQISVVGFDGIEAGEYYHPSLDTILQPAGEMALSSIECLFDMLQGGKPRHLVYEAVLARRGSSGKPRV